MKQTLKKHPAFLTLSLCLQGQRQLFPGFCICHPARHYSRGLKTLIIFPLACRAAGVLGRPGVSLTLSATHLSWELEPFV